MYTSSGCECAACESKTAKEKEIIISPSMLAAAKMFVVSTTRLTEWAKITKIDPVMEGVTYDE